MTVGLISLRSAFDVAATVARIVAALPRHGLTLIARVDHAAAAAKVGLALAPTELLIFGNPNGGTPLMQAAPTIAIDLPLRVLVWSDEHHISWLAYDDPHWLAARHGVPDMLAISPLAEVQAAIAGEATGAF